MRCPSLNELPPPPSGKTGWPWTEESPQLPGAMPDGKPWPKISIVTPSYNQGRFIEETIRSVLLQGYPSLEYIVIDGASTDGSVDIIRKYEDKLAYWVSEPDRGQAHAINKGFEKATGDIFGWINSDDYYYPGVFEVIARAFVEHPDIAMVNGYEHHVDKKGNVIMDAIPLFRNACTVILCFALPLQQLSCFWRNDAYKTIGGLDETLQYLLDYDFLLRLSYHYRSRLMYVPLCAGAFRKYPGQKTQQPEKVIPEHKMVVKRFLWQAGMPAWKRQVLFYWVMGLLVWRYGRAAGPIGVLKGWLRCAVRYVVTKLFRR